MWHRIGHCRKHVAKLTVYLPNPQSLRDFLVTGGIVVMLIKIPVCAIAVNIPVCNGPILFNPIKILGVSTQE